MSAAFDHLVKLALNTFHLVHSLLHLIPVARQRLHLSFQSFLGNGLLVNFSPHF
jgi:hypothetical protein